jgi:hypothetical protein
MYSIFLILISLSISGWCGKIIYPLNAAPFSVNGNHDHYELADGGDTNNKFEFWNRYHGLRYNRSPQPLAITIKFHN